MFSFQAWWLRKCQRHFRKIYLCKIYIYIYIYIWSGRYLCAYV